MRHNITGVALLLIGSSANGQTARMSVATAGAEGNGASFTGSISADGRFVAYQSAATNLVANDSNGKVDLFVRDRVAGTTERVSVSSTGAEGDGDSFAGSLSADGRFVAYQSAATNLVAGDSNASIDIFVRDRLNGTTERVSVDSAGAQANGSSTTPSLSADGRYVAFMSGASNLVASDVNSSEDVFVHDRTTGTTEIVSVDSNGVRGDFNSYAGAISADGNVVGFYSFADNLVAGDTNGVWDVFVHDRATGATERVSVDSSGNQGDHDSYSASLSADGRFVAFQSIADNLFGGDANHSWDDFVRDRQTGTTEMVSVNSLSQQENASAGIPSISGDGRLVAFMSSSSNLVPDDSNARGDVFLRDRLLYKTSRVSVDSTGVQGDNNSDGAKISADGNFVAFYSAATDLVVGDRNGQYDVFVRERGLTLQADPAAPLANTLLTFASWNGLPAGAMVLILTDLNGTPTFVPAVTSTFDFMGQRNLFGTVPPSLSGVVATFVVFGYVAPARAVLSNTVVISFQ